MTSEKNMTFGNGRRFSDIGTTPENARYFKELGYPISALTIRQLVKTGKIKARFVGNRPLTSKAEILRYFQCLDGQDNPPQPLEVVGGIRRLG